MALMVQGSENAVVAGAGAAQHQDEEQSTGREDITF
jgi:hypothetical protein